ncbi:MAG: hypothetical protein IPO91_20750 [Chloroflexi bacterium]|nr:hypothetical protein [Chloroflexota bacterium]
MKRIVMLLAVMLLCALPLAAQDDAQRVIDRVAQLPEWVDWLAQYPGSFGQANDDDSDGVWYVEFYAEEWSEWLGYANVVLETGEIVDSFIPAPLSAEEFQRGQDRVLPLVLNDAEILAVLGDTLLWDHYIDFNRYDRRWEVTFYRGVQAVQAVIQFDEAANEFAIEEIRDPNALEEQDQREAWRDEAISLAYSGEGAGEALNGRDDWTTYTENLRPGIWSVSFVAGETELYFALINVDTDEVLETLRP